jgi:hypothetical protein
MRREKMAPATYVDTVLRTHHRFVDLVGKAFCGALGAKDQGFLEIVDQACKTFVNSNGR